METLDLLIQKFQEFREELEKEEKAARRDDRHVATPTPRWSQANEGKHQSLFVSTPSYQVDGENTRPMRKEEGVMHDTVEGFMTGLRATPKGSPERGKFITNHVSHAPFLQALKAHPQGAQIHQMLTSHLDSRANAGFKPGSTKVGIK